LVLLGGLGFAISAAGMGNGISQRCDNNYDSMSYRMGLKRFKLGLGGMAAFATMWATGYAVPDKPEPAPTFKSEFEKCKYDSMDGTRVLSPRKQQDCLIVARDTIKLYKALDKK
jgi:hypothetical protein